MAPADRAQSQPTAEAGGVFRVPAIAGAVADGLDKLRLMARAAEFAAQLAAHVKVGGKRQISQFGQLDQLLLEIEHRAGVVGDGLKFLKMCPAVMDVLRIDFGV